MHLQTLSIEEFNDFQKKHFLSNMYQTINYAMLMAENGYDYELVGLLDSNNIIMAASLILLKSIGIKCFYGYAPRGFLMQYNDYELVKTFTEEIKKYFYEKNVIFIKLNPNIIIGEVEKNNYITKYNENNQIMNVLKNSGYKKLADNLYFEAMLPRFNAIINLKEFNTINLNKNTKNKIKKGLRKGLTFTKVDKDKISYFSNLMKDYLDYDNYYYQDYYTVFDKNEDIDLFLVKIDYDSYLKNSQYIYNKELEKNNKLNNQLVISSREKVINAKMNSDKNLLIYKNDIMEATKGLQEQKEEYIAGALVIKHNNIATIVYSAYNKDYKRFAPNYFLHYNIIKYYQENYDYLDLNGVVGDFKNQNDYTGLNRFKIGFNPHIYEYIGEFDLVIEPKSYEILLRNGILAKEFKKK